MGTCSFCPKNWYPRTIILGIHLRSRIIDPACKQLGYEYPEYSFYWSGKDGQLSCLTACSSWFQPFVDSNQWRLPFKDYKSSLLTTNLRIPNSFTYLRMIKKLSCLTACISWFQPFVDSNHWRLPFKDYKSGLLTTNLRISRVFIYRPWKDGQLGWLTACSLWFQPFVNSSPRRLPFKV